MNDSQEKDANDEFYTELSRSLLEEIFKTAFNGVSERTKLIEEEQSYITNKIDELNNSEINNQLKFQQDYKKCQEYCEKARHLKKQLVILNENCTNLKKRVFQLKEVNEKMKRKNSQLEQAEPAVVVPTAYKTIKKSKPREIATETTESDKGLDEVK